MAYSQHEWVNGEVITAEKLNNIEQGIADGEAREIAASASASVENTTGEPSCEVAAAGSVSSIDFKFAFKGIKGEQGEKGETGEKGADAPTITACEINIAGAVISGKLTFSDSSSVDITGTYTAESVGEEEEDGGDNDNGDNGDGGGNGESQPVEGETEPDGGESENPDAGEPESPADEESPEEGESEPEDGGETPSEGGEEE